MSNQTPGPSKKMKATLLPENDDRQESSNSFVDRKNVTTTMNGIISNYLDTWLEKSNHSIYKYNQPSSYHNPSYFRLIYIDVGFAGSRRCNSQNVDNGSPVTAYRLALQHERIPADGPEIDMIFIEETEKQSNILFEKLKQVKEEIPRATNVPEIKFMVINAEFASAMHWILSNNFEFSGDGFLKSVPQETSGTFDKRHRFVTYETPLFVFIDPSGGNGDCIPITLLKEIGRATAFTDILINLRTGILQRFELESVASATDLLIGQECDTIQTPVLLDEAVMLEKMKKFLGHYNTQISYNENTIVAVFETRNNVYQLLYNLFFVCRSNFAFCNMKRAMRKRSQNDYQFKYSSFKANDPNLNRDTLEFENLVQDIAKHFNDDNFRGQPIKGSDVIQFIDIEIEKSIHPVLQKPYKQVLKVHLSDFCINKRHISQQKFENMKFNFFSYGKVEPY